jgi:RNA 2',3'-cyclic 3'-phosphodiesterase
MPEQLSFPQAGVWPRPSDAWPRPEDWVFFALQPDRAVAMEIAELARHERAEHGLKGAQLGTDRFHVSLYGLGESAAMPQTTVAAAIDAAVSIVLPPFDVAFDRVLSFRGARKRRPLVLCGGDGLGALRPPIRRKAALEFLACGREQIMYITPHCSHANRME